MANRKILVIEDDRALSEIICYNLQQHGFEVISAFDGQSGLSSALHRPPEVVLLDVMLPVLDGIEVCRRLRSHPETNQCVILMLTAKAEEADQLLGFSVGADDYVVKPFSVKVLLERIKALRRRLITEPGDQPAIAVQGIVIDRVRHHVTLQGEELDLTPSEFRLLETLMRDPGRAYERNDLINLALGEDTVVLERTIDVHIRSLRKKLGESGDLIETVRGVGYRFQDQRNTKL
ncbi:MAG: winged helix-turn-helix domain-containing protein [Pirellulaceae bacterium]|nr:winged helix-turn-helix domain-containing protein [Pirellulaceae bacterium]